MYVRTMYINNAASIKAHYWSIKQCVYMYVYVHVYMQLCNKTGLDIIIKYGSTYH